MIDEDSRVRRICSGPSSRFLFTLRDVLLVGSKFIVLRDGRDREKQNQNQFAEFH